MAKSYSNDKIASSDSDGANLPAILTSYDYAAHAKLKATIVLQESGTQLEAHFAGEAKTEIPIPKDDNGNNIADYWEDTSGVLDKNYPETWDGEHVDGNDHDGDGLTLFEEYRGFLINGKYERLSPKVKDIFLRNETAFDLAGHVGLFESACQNTVKIHVCKAGELNQIVNPAQTEGKGGDQYAITVRTYAPDNPNELGHLFPKDAPKGSDNTALSPKAVEFLGLSTTVGNALDYALAHELAHGLGVHHHGDSRGDFYDHFYENNVLLNQNDTLIDEKGVGLNKETITSMPDKFSIEIAKKYSQASGDPNCIMCYNNLFEIADMDTTIGGKHALVFVQMNHLNGTTFCRTGTGVLWNDPNHQPFSVFGNAAKGRGNCWSMITIKTW
ncbi:MAG TPA: hypothetical protein VFD13_03865 [Candidatus Kapabacteria bacterium]|nr:hypothetical protein [Candidatus Kapabacteria bacterium]